MSNVPGALAARNLIRRRSRKVIIILGQKDMGKSSLAKYLVSIYPGKVVILDPAWNWATLGAGEYPSAAYRSPKVLEDWLNIDAPEGQKPRWDRFGPDGGMLIADDADVNQIPKNGSSTNWRFLWMVNRHLNGSGIDVVIISHRPQGIPLEAFAAADEIICFKMEEKNAQDYLEETSLRDYASQLGDLSKGWAIRVIKDPEPGQKRYAKINYFDVLPPPSEVNSKLKARFARDRAQGRSHVTKSGHHR